MLGALVESVVALTNLTTIGLLVATSLVYLTYRGYRSMRRPYGLPPGPRGLPFIGNILLFTKGPLYSTFKEVAKEYGDVFSIKLISKWVIVLNDIDVVKEALLHKQDQFAGRTKSYTLELATRGFKDIAFASISETWKLHRKLGHTALREFATGKKLEKLIFSMTSKLVDALEEKGDKPFDPHDMSGLIIYNIISSMCFGHDYAYDDPRIQKWIDLNKEQYRELGNGLAADFFPFMKHIPTPGLKRVKKLFKRFFDPIEKEFEEHKATYDPDNIRDLIDSLLKAQEDAIEEGSATVDSLTDTHLLMTVGDVFGAGTETAILTLHWAFALMCEYPEIQAKVAEECDRVIGHDRLPSLQDRGTLPYTEATLYEIFRYGTVTPVGVPHATMEDVTLYGYNIPKNTMVFVNHWGLHRDERHWKDPFNFKPEHFLDEAGEVRQHPNSFLPFSIGRRTCLGEAFAKAEAFLLFCWLFQHYTFSKVPGEAGSLLELDNASAGTHQVKPFKIISKKRF